METTRKMMWQNLVYRKCPKCDSRLVTEVKNSKLRFKCPSKEECGFSIAGVSYMRILMDKNHILRRFISEETARNIDEAFSVEKMLSNNRKTV